MTISDETLIFCILIICLGGCFVWAFWELEQMRNSRNERVRKLRRSTLR
jgi:predicted negative regulator of RcsB-dependent stress response